MKNVEKAKDKKPYDPALPWKILALASLVGFFASLFLGGYFSPKSETKNLPSFTCAKNDVEKAMNFINEFLVRGGEKANLVNYSSENVCWITTEYRGNIIPVMLKSSDELVILNIINMSQAREMMEKQKVQAQQSMQEIKKTEKPEVKLFIMSFCPYGRVAAEAMIPVYRLLKDKANIEVHYVIYPSEWYKGREKDYCIGDYCSMHGIKETLEDVRELCIAKLYGWDKYWDYMEIQLKECSMQNIDTCWKSSAEKAGIEISKIESCVEANSTSYLEEEYKLNQKYSVRGSPTIIINDAVYRGERTPEAFKNAICNAFKETPEECNEELSTQTSKPAGSCG